MPFLILQCINKTLWMGSCSQYASFVTLDGYWRAHVYFFSLSTLRLFLPLSLYFDLRYSVGRLRLVP